MGGAEAGGTRIAGAEVIHGGAGGELEAEGGEDEEGGQVVGVDADRGVRGGLGGGLACPCRP
jgi:hypothetical protein